jgi:hypothetical protein
LIIDCDYEVTGLNYLSECDCESNRSRDIQIEYGQWGKTGKRLDYRAPEKFSPGLGDLGIKNEGKNLLIPKSRPKIVGKNFSG